MPLSVSANKRLPKGKMTENRAEPGERIALKVLGVCWGWGGGGGGGEKGEAKSGDSETGDRKLRSLCTRHS